MKKLISIIALAAVSTAGVQTASAHDDRGWATTGKILTGLFVAGAISRALEPPPPPVYWVPAPVYVAPPAPVYVGPPVVVCPPPVIGFRFGVGFGPHRPFHHHPRW